MKTPSKPEGYHQISKSQSKVPIHVPCIPIARYRLSFTASAPIATPDYLGSAWRGIFGRALKRLVCINKSGDCPNCMVYRSCTYPYIFETPPPEDSEKLKGYTSAPHPYVLELPWKNQSRSTRQLELGVVLIGHANRYLTYVVWALRQGALNGFSKAQAQLRLYSVSQEFPLGSNQWHSIIKGPHELAPKPPASPRPPVPSGERIRVQLLTPLRLRHQEHYVTVQNFQFRDLFANLLRRVSFLMYFHTPYLLETSFAELVQRSTEVTILNPDLHWEDWTRYSSRQRTRMTMGGLLGSFELDASQLEPFWPYLWLGQFIHAGKGTTMGLGAYTLHFTESSVDPASNQPSNKLANPAQPTIGSQK